jgi:centrosomal CEP192-like protein
MESVEVRQGRTRAAQTKRSVRVLVACVLLGGALLAGALLASDAHAGSVTVSWTAPSTNTDGSPLGDLAGYRIYLGTSSPQCPGSGFLAVASPTRSPQAGQTISQPVTALSGGTTYFARITAVDTAGTESPCSSVASGVAHTDIAVTPSGTTSFDAVAVGGSSDRAFTVQNTSSASLTATVSVGAPFRIVSAASFSLNPGATQTVTVRFSPTTAGTFAGNVNVSASGDVISRGVSGSTTDQSPPPSSTPPGVPGSPSATQVTPDATGVTATIVWSPGSGATSYKYLAGFSDGTGSQQGTTSGATLALRMPYHASGAAASAWICVQSVNAAGVSADQACGTFSVPARPPDAAAPTISGLSPSSATAGSSGLTLTVNGAGFTATSTVLWNGAARPTTFVSSSQLRATISTADLASPASVPVSVVTPAPGGGTSSPVTFTIAGSQPAPPPATPGNPTASVRSADGSGVTIDVSWSPASGASSYTWVAGFQDGSAVQQGSAGSTSMQLRMPYHASGAAFGMFVCVHAAGPTGVPSAEQACGATEVPARR